MSSPQVNQAILEPILEGDITAVDMRRQVFTFPQEFVATPVEAMSSSSTATNRDVLIQSLNYVAMPTMRHPEIGSKTHEDPVSIDLDELGGLLENKEPTTSEEMAQSVGTEGDGTEEESDCEDEDITLQRLHDYLNENNDEYLRYLASIFDEKGQRFGMFAIDFVSEESDEFGLIVDSVMEELPHGYEKDKEERLLPHWSEGTYRDEEGISVAIGSTVLIGTKKTVTKAEALIKAVLDAYYCAIEQPQSWRKLLWEAPSWLLPVLMV